MNMRGQAQLDVFVPMAIGQYDELIRKYASQPTRGAEFFHSNLEGEVIIMLDDAVDAGEDAAIINPAGYTTGHPALMAAIGQVRLPTIELHISNPARRGRDSEIARVSRGVVTGFGIFGYFLALGGLQDMLAARAGSS